MKRNERGSCVFLSLLRDIWATRIDLVQVKKSVVASLTTLPCIIPDAILDGRYLVDMTEA